MQTNREQYAGFRTRSVSSIGSGSGPLFVMFHGFGDSADTWAGTMRSLARRGADSIAYDLPGFAAADDVRTGPVLPQLRDFVVEVVASLPRHRPLVLVGNSLGSCAALLAVDAGVSVAGVVATAEPTLGRSLAIRLFRMPVRLPLGWLDRLPLPRRITAAVTRPPMRRALAWIAADPALAHRVEAHLYRSGGIRPVLKMVRGLAMESVGCYEFARADVPLLIVHGHRDRIIPVNSARRLHELLPHAQLVIDRDWGHCPQLEDADRLAGLLLEFGSALAADRPASA